MVDADGIAVAPAFVGKGLFARRVFAVGEAILVIRGPVVRYELLWRRGGTFAANCYRYGPETYLDPGNGPARYVNHSCEPNAAVHKRGRRLVLVAARRIRAGEEIRFDYSTTIGDDDIWTMRCRCGSRSCRKVIRRFGTLPLALRKRYFRRGMVPAYIIRTLTEGP